MLLTQYQSALLLCSECKKGSDETAWSDDIKVCNERTLIDLSSRDNGVGQDFELCKKFVLDIFFVLNVWYPKQVLPRWPSVQQTLQYCVEVASVTQVNEAWIWLMMPELWLSHSS